MLNFISQAYTDRKANNTNLRLRDSSNYLKSKKSDPILQMNENFHLTGSVVGSL